MKSKSPITVRRAVETVFNDLPETFSAPRLCRKVKHLTERPDLMDGTILRRLREARADSLDFQYRCIDTEKALYQKQQISTT